MIAVNDMNVQESAAVVAFFHHLFRYPTHEQWLWLNQTEVKETLNTLVQDQLMEVPSHDRLYPEKYTDYEELFVAVFEVGVPHPPCPLIESHWDKSNPVPKVLHENMLFYKKFGLQLKDSSLESADHLRFQLEFYSYLLQLQATCSKADGSDEKYLQIQQAKTDYLQRHILCWLPKAVETLQQKGYNSWPYYWLKTVETFFKHQEEIMMRDSP